MGELLSFFQSSGSATALLPSRPFSLVKSDTVYAISQAPINLFARSGNGERYFLGHFQSGLLFSMPQSSYELIAISEEETTLFELPIEALAQVPQELFAAALDAWTHRLTNALDCPSIILPECPISAGETIQVPSEHLLVSHKKTDSKGEWIEIIEGELFFLDRAPFQSGILPLASGMWFASHTDTTVRSIDSLQLVQNKLWEKGLKTFSQIFLLVFQKKLEEKTEQEKRLLESRIANQEMKLSDALAQMGSVFEPDIMSSKDPFIHACNLLGSEMQVEFVFPREALAASDVIDKLDFICKASQLQKRKVRLLGEWWKENHGPLLGFYGPEKKPIALIPKWNTYSISNREALEIDGNAYMFYTAFPLDLKTGREVLAFAMKKYAKQWLSIIPFSIVGGLFALFPPFATKLLFTYAIPQNKPSLVLYLALGLLFSALGAVFFQFLRGLLTLKLEGISAHLIQTALWDRLLKLAPSFFRKFSTGNLFWRVSSIDEIHTLLSGSASVILLTGLLAFLYLAVMFAYSPLLSALVISIALVAFVITLICSIIKARIIRKALSVEGNLRGLVNQMIGGIAKLRVAGVEASAFAYWASFFAKVKSLKMRAQHIQNIVMICSSAFPIFSTWVIYLGLIEWVHADGLALPDFLAFNVAYSSFIMAFYPMCSACMQLVNCFPLWERSKVILEEPLESHKRQVAPGKLTGAIRVDSVVFGYDSSRPPILEQISLEIRPRELIAIVGPSGSGKSTIFRLLLGFEKPHSGVVYFDDKDLSTLDLRATRKQMGVVLQEEALISGNLYDNLVCGGIYSGEEIQKALELSGFDEDLEGLPMGLHTVVTSGSAALSGGQRQRLLLARALLSNPSILLFDEATSALDNRSQEKVSANIDQLNVTRIVIAHNLSTIRHADRIYVLERGKIKQVGTYEELSEAPGVFAEMIKRQEL